jgi:hypothetical protein
MVDHCARFGTCEVGEIKTTPGYLLPAKYVLHAIPPERGYKNKKDLLRKLYRDVLFAASGLKATTIALPSIGTGALNYSVNDCAAIALEEVKRFLEMIDESTTIRKIIFVVFASNDESIYKSRLPWYFPPLDTSINQTIPQTPSRLSSPYGEDAQASQSSPGSAQSPPRRSLFSSIGEAFRSVRLGGKQQHRHDESDGGIRRLSPPEKEALLAFEHHAQACPTCNDVAKIYSEGQNLCAEGYAAAQVVLRHLYMDPNQHVYSTNLEDLERVRVRVNRTPGAFPHSWNLLATVEKSFSDAHRSRPFVSPNQSYEIAIQESDEEVPPGVTIHRAEVTVPLQEHERTGQDAVWLFNQALQKANTAVELEKAHNDEGAIEAYAAVVELLDQAMLRRREDQTQLGNLDTLVSNPTSRGHTNELLSRCRRY